jgi:high-affinity Fe2+/Pb2+ permease
MDPDRTTYPNWITLAAGLLVALVAAGLLLLGIIESGPAAALGILGIGLIAASARGRRTRS